MEKNKDGQLGGIANFLLDNRPTSLDTILRIGLPGSTSGSLLAMNHSEQLNGDENEHPYSSNVANNQALLLPYHFGSPSNNNNNVNRFGHGTIEHPLVGLDHPWFKTNANNVDHLHEYRQQEKNNVTIRNITRRRKNSVSNRVCSRCGTKTTPMWRRGPDGPQTHCNACGLWYARLSKKLPGELGNELGDYY